MLNPAGIMVDIAMLVSTAKSCMRLLSENISAPLSDLTIPNVEKNENLQEGSGNEDIEDRAN